MVAGRAAVVVALAGVAGCGGSAQRAAATRPAPTLPPESAAERAAAAQALAEEERTEAVRTTTAAAGGAEGIATTRRGTAAAASASEVTLTAAHQPLARRAITASDNAAAAQLWGDLGPQAGPRTGAVLTDAGAPGVVVQTRTIRPGLSPYGQTRWSVAGQARFAGTLPCTDGARTALALMGQVQHDQRWGLGILGSSARFKGGWGPGADGAYLVRQLGIVTTGGGQLAVAIATKPADGTFATATTHLTTLAAWVRDHVRGAAPAPC